MKESTADSRVWTIMRNEVSEMFGGAGCERPIQPAPRSVPAPRPPTPCSAPAPSFSATPALRSAPLQPIFDPLSSVSRFTHMLWYHTKSQLKVNDRIKLKQKTTSRSDLTRVVQTNPAFAHHYGLFNVQIICNVSWSSRSSSALDDAYCDSLQRCPQPWYNQLGDLGPVNWVHRSLIIIDLCRFSREWKVKSKQRKQNM